MKTVFKVGMEVYDSVNYPGEKGEVIKTEKSIPYTSRPIQVKFESNIEDYTLDGRIGTFNQIPTLSTSPYTLQGFEQKAPAPTFETAVNWIASNNRYNPVYAEINKKEKVFLSETYFYAFDALRKLTILRDYYNEGWQPDWRNYNEIKWTIENVNNNLTVTNEYTFNQVMFFNSEKLAFKFLEEQKELLEIAKPLL